MAKKQNGEQNSSSQRDTEQLRLSISFLQRLKVVAAGLGLTPREYAETRLTPMIDNDMPSVMEAMMPRKKQDSSAQAT